VRVPQGCVLKQTPFIFALVVYTGHQTKLFLNSGCAPALSYAVAYLSLSLSWSHRVRSMAPSKRTSLEKYLNRAILLMMGFQVRRPVCSVLFCLSPFLPVLSLVF
jgi:hypothetical protein